MAAKPDTPTVLVAIDASELSRASLPIAADLAIGLGGGLHIVMVIDGTVAHSLEEITPGGSLNESADALVAEIVEHHDTGDATVTWSCPVSADAPAEIVKAAGNVGASFIVLTSHGRSGLSRLLAGSVAEAVMRMSEVPVVVVPVRWRHRKHLSVGAPPATFADVRIGILTQYFEPEIGAAPLRYRAVTRALADAGHEVVVVTSLPNHPTGRIFEGYRSRPYRTEHTDVATVHRSWLFPAVGSGAKRYLNFLSFAMAVLPLLRHLRRCDVVLVESPPITVGALGFVIRYLLRRPYVTYVSDLSSNSVADLEIPGGRAIGAAMRAVESAVYARSAAVTVVTDGQVRTLTDEFGIDPDDILMLQNGADTELFGPREVDLEVLNRFGVEPNRYVLYAGTHGFAHGLDVAIEAATLIDDGDFVFLFVGEGSDKERIVSLAAERGADNCSFFGQVPPDVVAELYAGSLAGLSTVRDIGVMRDARPAKLFATMCSARPIIYSGSGEGAGIVEAAGAGIVCEVEKAQPIVDAIGYLQDHPDEAETMGKAGRSHIESHFSWPVLVGTWVDALRVRLGSTDAPTRNAT